MRAAVSSANHALGNAARHATGGLYANSKGISKKCRGLSEAGARGRNGGIRKELAAGVSKKRRIYKPRLVDGKVMMTADLRCLLKYMPDERIDHISDEMRAVVESEWPELAHKRAQETAGLTHASLKALLENACWPCYRFRHEHPQTSSFLHRVCRHGGRHCRIRYVDS
jgi:hypothetical protein